ncbi:MAG: leucine-rich repeat domain-containing protein [Planctomycetia bacterium]|nr:leucine-rich repeat domain-containing protein [Planctomycetia bacterium]
MPPVEFHIEPQDTECEPWKRLCDLVEEAAVDGREEFAPLRGVTSEERAQIVTLPQTIGKLTKVKHLLLYGSHLVRIPPEIGEMTNLEKFTPYTSYRLHWYPYEITRCKNLRDSTVSTRALYGNRNYHPPFPRLEPGMHAGRVEPTELPLKCTKPDTVRRCSVCDRPFKDQRQHRVWISLRVATDVLPLLVNACSDECIGRLPTPAKHYLQVTHRGDPDVRQPHTTQAGSRGDPWESDGE